MALKIQSHTLRKRFYYMPKATAWWILRNKEEIGNIIQF